MFFHELGFLARLFMDDNNHISERKPWHQEEDIAKQHNTTLKKTTLLSHGGYANSTKNNMQIQIDMALRSLGTEIFRKFLVLSKIIVTHRGSNIPQRLVEILLQPPPPQLTY